MWKPEGQKTNSPKNKNHVCRETNQITEIGLEPQTASAAATSSDGKRSKRKEQPARKGVGEQLEFRLTVSSSHPVSVGRRRGNGERMEQTHRKRRR